MNTLGKRQFHQDLNQNPNFGLPAVVRRQSNEIPLGKALVISTIGHPAVIAFIWLIVKLFLLLMAILGITLPIFERPQPKVRDIEFVLVNKPEEKPINPNTKFRADRNTRAGGKHDPNRPVSEPEPRAVKSVPQKPAVAPRPRMVQKPKQSQQPQRQVEQEAPIPPRPAPKQSFPKPRMTPPNAFNIPVPKARQPKASDPAGGPVTSAPMGSSSPSSSPSPVMSSSGNAGSPSRGRYSSGYSIGGGNAGNPGPGNPNGRPGIDAIKEPDFGPYMRELQRRIKRNWEPPKGNESKRVVLLFKIARDGRLISRPSVQRSSGNPEADQAAIAAVELSAPFRPLPPEYRGNDIDIQFTFDYNVFGVGGRRY